MKAARSTARRRSRGHCRSHCRRRGRRSRRCCCSPSCPGCPAGAHDGVGAAGAASRRGAFPEALERNMPALSVQVNAVSDVGDARLGGMPSHDRPLVGARPGEDILSRTRCCEARTAYAICRCVARWRAFLGGKGANRCSAPGKKPESGGGLGVVRGPGHLTNGYTAWRPWGKRR